jgi:hypothetical protein
MGSVPAFRSFTSRCARIRLMSEIIFVVEEAPDGGFAARAVGESIFAQASTMAELHGQVRDAVRCHFDEAALPKLIRLHFVRDEVIAA